MKRKMVVLKYPMALIILLAAIIPTSLVHAQESDEVGAMITIRAEDLPKPYETPVEALSPRQVSTNKKGELNLPPGFKVNPFRRGLTHARWLYALDNGDVLLAEPKGGKITILRDVDGDGKAELAKTLVDDLETPHGMAIIGDWLYIGEETQVRRVPFKVGNLDVSGQLEDVTEPGSLGDGHGHWTRILLYDEKDNALYISVGSASNVGIEPLPRASIQKLNLENKRMETVATGLRNPVGMDFNPVTGALYTVVNERDGYGDGLVPDYLTEVKQGGFYGWPYAYSGKIPDPDYADKAPEMVEKSILPDVLFQSHSAPLGLTFYRADQFPDDYKNDAFVAFQGSWNASNPTGYKIVRVPFENGYPTGSYQNFATGFRIEANDPGAAKVWGRPVGLAVAADGSLLIADAVSQTVWRISYAP
ncbi:PQQ-dependent sugar dehydrogenase [Sneathiella litorea]|uniref:Sorbosone dehydrogenase n=1 Tax=Sneathiella litorea TaxID=2606216 RepID=A0A6L8W3J2_9PROT|nr:PQQ-dependent sugar dehydrogenase [Sneathiella litorea]MZR29133.1 sorbosone dehydrogenase [Sneathiella litorea]